ncbi:hypothetical protein PIB30_068498 [Stylosanthes scabra]|uniref:Uncharacterized protein n=1 Tax=Stylosanthes scabra TaxID=79078 RepID=A0ABU6VLW5_9FABA|nr:hypothetical protein [Stylosanthes scabra]
MNALRVTLRESKRHEGAYRASDPAYDNSGLSDVVDDWGVFGLTSQFTGRYIRNVKERNPQVYMIKRNTVNGWGIERVVLGEMRMRTPVSWLCLSRLSRWKGRRLSFE